MAKATSSSLPSLSRALGRLSCFLAIVLLVTTDVRFSFHRSTSITDTYKYNNVNQKPGHHYPSTAVDALTAINGLPPVPTAFNATSGLEASLKFYLIPTPEVTDWILGNHSEEAFHFYEHALNEDQAELWIYRSLQRHPSRTLDSSEADIFIICGCLHWNYHLTRRPRQKRHQKGRSKQQTNLTFDSLEVGFDAKAFADAAMGRLVNRSKPHLLAIPTTNPGTSRYIGVKAIVKALEKSGVEDVWSLGFERNKYWQGLPPDRIIPIPYVVRLPVEASPVEKTQKPLWEFNRTDNFIFYAGDRRAHAKEWSGCDRSMLAPLARKKNMDVRLIDKKPTAEFNRLITSNRLTEEEYNHRMRSSEYCLIMCGDSPTSRSLTSAFVHGCIPLRVGSRLRGLCEKPCHKGWGWTISGMENPHLPFSGQVSWTEFPEVNEMLFQDNPARVLRQTLAGTPDEQRDVMRDIMHHHRDGFIYGWGNPVNSTSFGHAVSYSLQSFVDAWGRQAAVKGIQGQMTERWMLGEVD